jgi:hypothetical protein
MLEEHERSPPDFATWYTDLLKLSRYKRKNAFSLPRVLTFSKEIWLAYFKLEVELATRARLQSDITFPEKNQKSYLNVTEHTLHLHDVSVPGNLIWRTIIGHLREF